MNMDILKKYIKRGNISIPSFIFSNFKKLNITSDEFIILIYLINKGENISYDPKMMASEIDYKEEEILLLLNRLNEKRIIEIVVSKNEKNIMEENISLNMFYEKLTSLIVSEKKETTVSNLFEIFENEFGRTLSPMEYELINAWLAADFKEEIIVEALKEATLNGVSNLRYIDKIIYEWKKKNLKSIDEIRKYNKSFRKNKVESKELFDYNWLEDEE